MPGRDQEPSFQLASGTTDERDYSYNISNTLGSIFYNTDTSNVEIRHEDPSNTLEWRDLVMNNKEQIDISGKLVVDGDVSFNAHMSAVDASFQNNVDISGKLVVNSVIKCKSALLGTGGTLDLYSNTNMGDSMGYITLRSNATVIAGSENIRFITDSSTNDSGNEVMRILANGNVGIGKTNPSAILNVHGGGLYDGDNIFSSKVCGLLEVGRGGGSNANDTGHGAILEFRHHSDNRFVTIQSVSEGTFSQKIGLSFQVCNQSVSPVNFEAMRITHSGNVTVVGTVTATNVPVTSDDRIKENEKLIVNATETLSKLTPQIYDKYQTMDLSGSSTIESGLIAQEVYYNAPELRHLVVVGKDTDASGNQYTPTPEEMDLSGVDIANDPDYGSHGWSKTEKSAFNYSGLIAYLIKSNQELAERIETLKTENTELKTDISFIKTENIELTTDISFIKTENIELTTDISFIKTENTELKTDISFIKTENTELTTDISMIRNHIGI